MTELGGSARPSPVPAPPPAAPQVFGAQLDGAVRYAELLATHGVERGLIGPREVERLWDRHLLNSAVVAELIPQGARIVDVGSGAGLPGVPLALARPDLNVTLVEPMERRVRWLDEVGRELGLRLSVVRGRAEERELRRLLGERDVVTARAVAPLARLAGWCLPLVRTGGRLLALKGASAAEEVERDRQAVARAEGGPPEIRTCGHDVLTTPTTVVVIERVGSASGRDRGRRTRKDR